MTNPKHYFRRHLQIAPKISKDQQLAEVTTFRLEVVSMVPGSQAAAASGKASGGVILWSSGPPTDSYGFLRIPTDSHGFPRSAQGLFVVKNRLPPSLEQLPPEPLLTEEDTQPEICSQKQIRAMYAADIDLRYFGRSPVPGVLGHSQCKRHKRAKSHDLLAQ